MDNDYGLRLIYSGLFDIVWLESHGGDVDPNELMDRNIFTEVKLKDLPEAALNNLTNLGYIQLKADNNCKQK